MGFTKQLARFVAAASFSGLPGQAVTISKDMMINAAAAGLAGAAQPEGRTVTTFVHEMGGNGKCTIIGQGLRTSPVNAALVSGAMVRLLDFDDEIAGLDVHPSSVVFPAVMALGEMNGYSGREVLNAFALGCELTVKLARLARSMGEDSTAGLGRNWEAIAGTIGAASAASRLLGLDQDQTENAIALAWGGAPNIQSHSPSPGLALQFGQAAMHGVMAALLAQRGFGGSARALEASAGLASGHGARGNLDVDAFLNGLANPFDVVRPGVTLKVYPCHSAGHTSIEAVLQLAQQYRIEPGQVELMTVGVRPATLRALPFSEPQTGWEAKSSLKYAAAAALLGGQPLIEQFTDGAVQAPEVRSLMERVAVEPVEDANPLPAGASTVTVKLSGGRRLQHTVELVRGRPELPLDRDELDAKFLYCSRYILPPDHIEGAIEQFRDLENVADITGLASILGG